MKKIILKDPFISERSKPQNIKDEDEHLFKHEYKKQFNSSYYLVIYNSIIVNRFVYLLKNLSFFTKYTYFSKPKFSRFLKDTYKNLFRSRKSSIIIKEAIWICDDKSSVYFHWLFDALMKFFNLPNEIKKNKIILPKEYCIDWIIEFLEYLKIDYFVLEPNCKVKVKKLYIPSYTAPSGNFNKEILIDLRNQFIKNYDSEYEYITNKKRIWIDMKKHRRPIENILEIQPILKKYNFEEVVFEDLSINQKIELLHNTEILMGSHSSGLSNMLFMNKGASIIDIRDPNDNIKNAFFTLSSELDLKYYYMEREDTNSNIVINPNKLENLLISLL